MSTWSGTTYKRLEKPPNMEQTLKSMEQMMLQLVEDWCKREEEFAAEREVWEKAAERHMEAM